MRESADDVEVRLAVAEDEDAIARLHQAQEPDAQPLIINSAEWEGESASSPRGRFVAATDGDLVGTVEWYPAWWTGEDSIYMVMVRVDESHGRRGIGNRLFERMRSGLLACGATRLLAWIREDSVAGRSFAARLGFEEMGEVMQDYRLHLPEADTSQYAAREQRLASAGIRIAALADLPRQEESFLRALQRLWADSGDTPPDPERLRESFPTWKKQVLDDVGLSPQTHWVALEGERPVGMTFLKRLSEDGFENDYTGVASTHRGRGIGAALKLRSILWGQQQGARWFYTSSEVDREAILHLNTVLGYVAGAKRLLIALDLR
jgi:GNAT superfamily N-acetyltransferase